MTEEGRVGEIANVAMWPFMRPAQSAVGTRWREEHAALISIIRYADNGLALTPNVLNYRMDAVERAEETFYRPTAEAADRADFIRWLAMACVGWNNSSQGGGFSVAHIFCGKLMQAWAGTRWSDIEPPKWATELLTQVCMDQRMSGAALTPRSALRDIQTFLRAYRKALGGALPRTQLNDTTLLWNAKTMAACMSWRLLASVQPGAVPARLVDELLWFERTYNLDDKDREIRQRIDVSWERHLLECVPGGMTGDQRPVVRTERPAIKRRL